MTPNMAQCRTARSILFLVRNAGILVAAIVAIPVWTLSCRQATLFAAPGEQGTVSGLNNHRIISESAGWQGSKGSAIYRLAPGAELEELSGGELKLEHGEMIIEPAVAVSIATPLVLTRIKHHCAVLFRVQRGSERCMVLCDSGPSSVDMICQGHKWSLGPGEEAFVSNHEPSYREITEPDEIGRRRIKVHNLNGQEVVVTSEFSLFHALKQEPLLYDLAHSKNKHDRNLRERIIKTAAVLNLVTHDHGAYTTTSGY